MGQAGSCERLPKSETEKSLKMEQDDMNEDRELENGLLPKAKENGNGPAGSGNGHINKMEEADEKMALVPRVFKRRWLMVFLFAGFSASNAYQWIHLNIIFNVIHRYYNESLPGDEYQQHLAIHWLSMIYMLAYIPFILPATWLLDRKGLRVVGIIATLLNATGAWVKCIAIDPSRFPVLMFGQTICALAQTCILGIPARLAAVWFGNNEVSTATAIGVFGNQIGCALGFLIPPEIVPDVEDFDVITKKLQIMLYSTAAITTLFFILVLIIYKKEPPVPPSTAQVMIVEAAAHENYGDSLKRLILNPNFILLTITYGANTGSYYAIGTLLNPIVLEYFPGATTDAGRIGLTLVVSGVGGSILAGMWLDRTKLFKATTVGIYFMSFVGMIVFTFTLRLKMIWLVYLCSATLGFFMTGYLPVGFEFAAEITYPESEGTSSGILNASAQAFGIALTLGMGAVMDQVGTLAANGLVTVTLLAGTIATMIIKSDLRRQKASQQAVQENEKELTVECKPEQNLLSKTNGETNI